jgi:peptidoglycan/LPS O-acetylase OafA/YrhL
MEPAAKPPPDVSAAACEERGERQDRRWRTVGWALSALAVVVVSLVLLVVCLVLVSTKPLTAIALALIVIAALLAVLVFRQS